MTVSSMDSFLFKCASSPPLTCDCALRRASCFQSVWLLRSLVFIIFEPPPSLWLVSPLFLLLYMHCFAACNVWKETVLHLQRVSFGACPRLIPHESLFVSLSPPQSHCPCVPIPAMDSACENREVWIVLADGVDCAAFLIVTRSCSQFTFQDIGVWPASICGTIVSSTTTL